MNGCWTHLFLLWLQNIVSRLNDPAFRRGAAHAGGTSYCQVPLVRRSSAPSLRQRGQTRVVWIDSSEALLWNHFSNLQPSLACYSLPTSAHRHPGQCKRRELGEREIYWHQNSPSHHWGLPWWFRWYRIHLQCGRPGFDPWVGKIFWRREQLPNPVFWPGEFHGQRSVAVHGVAKSWTWLSDFHLLLRHILYVIKTWLQQAELFTWVSTHVLGVSFSLPLPEWLI